MEIPQIQEKLVSLENSLGKIKTLLAWEQLKLSEARLGDRPGGFLPDSVNVDLKNQYSNFLYISLQAHCLISNADFNVMPPENRQQFAGRLRQLDSNFRELNLSKRFINF